MNSSTDSIGSRFLTCFELVPSTPFDDEVIYESHYVNSYELIRWADGAEFDAEVECKINKRHPSTPKRPDSPLLNPTRGPLFEINWSSYSELLVTPKVLSAFQEAGFTGFSAHSVRWVVSEIDHSRPRKTPELYNLVVSGSGGRLHGRSGHVVWSVCKACGYIRHSDPKFGMWVAAARWDGADFFHVDEYPWVTLVTSRVTDMIIKNGWSVCTLIRSTDVSF